MAKDSKDAKFELKTLVFNGPSGKDSGHQNTMTQHRISGKPGEGKVPGWMKDEKYLYTDQNVQELVKKVEVPGVGGAEGAKGQGAQEVRKPCCTAKANLFLSFEDRHQATST